ncbi:hypothetical protein [Marinilabilia salmonicolor]|uniref:hypothetical protein n=1 Tax=Marinilabilia salmonicolor TaxID=989 RepID=UPI00029A8F46|nr:hypothetical protein [Marinilabilia salmonicolor]
MEKMITGKALFVSLLLFFFGIGQCFAQQNSPDTIKTVVYLEKIFFQHGDAMDCIHLRTVEDGFFNFALDCQADYDDLVRYHVRDKKGIWLVENINYKNTGRKDSLSGRFNSLSLSDDFLFSFIQNRLQIDHNRLQNEVDKKVRLTFPISDQDSIYDYCVIDFMDYTDSIKLFSYFGQSEDKTGLSFVRSDSIVLTDRERKKLIKFFNKIRPVDISCKFNLNSWLYEISEKDKETVYYVLSDHCAMDSRSRNYKYKYRLYHYLRYLCSLHFNWYPQDDKYYL